MCVRRLHSLIVKIQNSHYAVEADDLRLFAQCPLACPLEIACVLLFQMELMQQTGVKAEIQSLAAIAPDFLTNIYLPNKLWYGGWV